MPYNSKLSDVDCSELNSIEKELNKLLDKSFREVREYSCAICKTASGKIYLSEPSKGTKFRLKTLSSAMAESKPILKCKNDDIVIGELHTHPYMYGDTPSEIDIHSWIRIKKPSIFDFGKRKLKKKNLKWLCISTFDDNGFKTTCYDADEMLKEKDKIPNILDFTYRWSHNIINIPHCVITYKPNDKEFKELIKENTKELNRLYQEMREKERKYQEEQLKKGKIVIVT